MQIELDKYKQRLSRADWHYEYASGHVYQQGRDEMRMLELLSHLSPEHTAAFNEAWARNRKHRQ